MLFVALTFPAYLFLKSIKYHSTFLFISLWAVHDDFCHCLLWLRREGETHSDPTVAHPPTVWAVRATCYSATWVKNPTKSHKLCFKCSQSFYRGCSPVFPVGWQCSPCFLFLWQTWSSCGPGLWGVHLLAIGFWSRSFCSTLETSGIVSVAKSDINLDVVPFNVSLLRLLPRFLFLSLVFSSMTAVCPVWVFGGGFVLGSFCFGSLSFLNLWKDVFHQFGSILCCCLSWHCSTLFSLLWTPVHMHWTFSLFLSVSLLVPMLFPQVSAGSSPSLSSSPVPCLGWYWLLYATHASSTLYFVFSVPADSLDSFLQIFLSLKDCSLQVPPALMTPQDVCVCVCVYVCECVSMCGSAITTGHLDPMPGCLHQRGQYPGPPPCTKCPFQSGSLKTHRPQVSISWGSLSDLRVEP